MLDELIEKAKKKRKLVSIYRSEDTERFMTGYILACSDEFLLLSEIDCYGNYDGFMVLKRDALYRCEIESTRAKRAQKLYSLRGQQHPTIKVQDEEEIIRSIEYHLCFSIAMALRFAAAIVLEGQTLCGYQQWCGYRGVPSHQKQCQRGIWHRESKDDSCRGWWFGSS